MALRAVIFDYGMVLTGKPDAEAHDAMIRITGLPADRFEALYWADRHAYDEGKLTGIAFWQRFLLESGLILDAATVEELNHLMPACGPRRIQPCSPGSCSSSRAAF